MIIKSRKNRTTFDECVRTYFLELDHLALLSLVATELEVLTSLDWLHGHVLLLIFTVSGLHLEHNLLGGLCLLVEDRLGLTTITALLSVVSPSALAEGRLLALLVLSHLEILVFPGGRAVGLSRLWNVDHDRCPLSVSSTCDSREEAPVTLL